MAKVNFSMYFYFYAATVFFFSTRFAIVRLCSSIDNNVQGTETSLTIGILIFFFDFFIHCVCCLQGTDRLDSVNFSEATIIEIDE